MLFVPWLLSCVSDQLGLDLFAVCYTLGLRNERARAKYARTRSLLDAYWHSGWLKKESVLPERSAKEEEVRPEPSIHKRPKGRDDIPALGRKMNRSGYTIPVPRSWQHFTRNERELYSFPKFHDDCVSNVLPKALAAMALYPNAELRNKVCEDSNAILNRKGDFRDLLNRYFFLVTPDERNLKIHDEKAVIQLAAFGLFQYADWSWKRSNAVKQQVILESKDFNCLIGLANKSVTQTRGHAAHCECAKTFAMSSTSCFEPA